MAHMYTYNIYILVNQTFRSKSFINNKKNKFKNQNTKDFNIKNQNAKSKHLKTP